MNLLETVLCDYRKEQNRNKAEEVGKVQNFV